ncbi:MAG: preprotein translocase subunit YajC [Planctomycetes bacterium]|nr:preprotein translocase subunit YajC [Planctomycetota bacterium]
MMEWITIIAQNSGGSPTGGGGGAGTGLFMALMFGVIAFMMLTMRSQKKREKKQREELYARLGKNDRILTVGGVIGTVVSVKDNEVLVKVDESTNTKMTFLKTSIQRIVTDDKDLATAATIIK